MTFEDFESFLAEGVCTIDFKHANVLTLFGVVNENDGRPLIILPYMENGDLRTLIHEQNEVRCLFLLQFECVRIFYFLSFN